MRFDQIYILLGTKIRLLGFRRHPSNLCTTALKAKQDKICRGGNILSPYPVDKTVSNLLSHKKFIIALTL